ncbi:MAG: recombinase family protein, partial [Planctomycetaceae bacterium]|nr:recombinase family protein [Planctomycetaceae bacterium]
MEKLIVLIYARYSTDDQNPSSITDQVAYCKRFLAAWGITDVEFIIRYDEAISGELSSRPGINAGTLLIRDGKCHVVIAEDSSRLFRNPSACLEFFETAVDADVRVICINDRIDTAEDDWFDRLYDAQRHHRQSNEFTRHRILRRHEALWLNNKAIGLLRCGYRRVPSTPDTDDKPEAGTFVDQIDPSWMPIVGEAFKRIASGEVPQLIADFLTRSGLPKTSNSKSNEWTVGTVKALIKNPIYRGVEERNKTIGRKQRRVGRRKRERNAPESVRLREMPHLRMVDDWLWYAANDAIRGRDHGSHHCGRDNSQYGVPRDSRGPLSKRLFCLCGAPMDRSAPGGYRCSLAGSRKRKCWVKATAKTALVHRAVARAISDRVDQFDAGLDDLLKSVHSLCNGSRSRRDEEAALESQLAALKADENRLRQLATSDAEPLDIVRDWVVDLQRKLDRVAAELDRLKNEQASLRIPTASEVRDRIQELRQVLAAMDRHSGPLLQQLVSKIVAFPCQQVGGNKIVLRARIQL